VGSRPIPEGQIETIAWLAVPDFLEAFMDWMKERDGVRNQAQMQFLVMIASFVHPRFGYLRQRPERQPTLPAQYQQEQRAQLCDRQFELIEQLVSAYLLAGAFAVFERDLGAPVTTVAKGLRQARAHHSNQWVDQTKK
jgi:hypothetical protein